MFIYWATETFSWNMCVKIAYYKIFNVVFIKLNTEVVIILTTDMGWPYL